VREFARYLADFAWFWPGVAITIVVGIALGGRVGTALGLRRAVASLLLLGFGVILSATLTPSREALAFGTTGSGICDLSRIGLAPLGQLIRFGDPALNVFLYIPLGAAIGMASRSRYRILLAVGAAALPFAIEGTQLIVTWLDRACQSSDVSDNLTGLVIGALIGWLVLFGLEGSGPA
jgi:glycopeptide antibiotics resistance protein